MPLEIRPTGVFGLDTVLGGGLPRGTLLLLAGPPGTGKTILSQQLCFAWVKSAPDEAGAAPRKAIYFSTLSEPHSKLIAHSESFSFFDAAELGRSVEIFSLQEFMSRGLEETAAAIVRQVRQLGAGLVVVDGFRAIEALSQTPVDTREFLYKLSVQLSMLGATTVITVERSVRDSAAYGDFTTADAVIGLHNTLVNVQHRRRLEVLKLRGVRHLAGLHSYQIGGDGWRIFPRLESLIPTEDPGEVSRDGVARASFGLPELDAQTHGGLPYGSTTLIAGSPGVGKTLLSLSYLHAGLQAGEPGLFLGFHEDRQQLLSRARTFNMPLDEFIASGMLTIHTLPAVELEVDQFSSLLRAQVERTGVRRLVLDSVTSIESAAERENRAEDYAAALHTYLRQRGVTTLFIKELRAIDSLEIQSADSPLAIVCENLIIMRYVWHGGLFYRELAVVKMRDSAHERRVCQFVIEQQRGVRILGDAESQTRAISSITRGLDGGDLTGLELTRGVGKRKRSRRGARDAGVTGEANG